MALSSLRYDASSSVEETKGGIFVYDGTASRFHEWEFRTTLRIQSSKEEDLPKQMSMVVDGLRGDAAQIAIDLGTSKILGATGLKDLVDAMRASVFPQARAEAKELYKVGHKAKGVLSRQPGEPMVNYISRRKRWWRSLQEMDSSISQPRGTVNGANIDRQQT